MTTLTAEQKDLVLWVLDNSHPSLEDSASEDIHGPFVVRLTLEQLRALSLLLEQQMDNLLDDVERCITDTGCAVLNQHHGILDSIAEALNTAKPLVSAPSNPPGDCLHPA